MLSAPLLVLLVRDAPPSATAPRAWLKESEGGAAMSTAQAVSGWTGNPVVLWSCGPVVLSVVLRQSARCRPTVRGQHGVIPFAQEPLVAERTGQDRCWNVLQPTYSVQYSVQQTLYEVTLTVV
jgi:hypothetical protein